MRFFRSRASGSVVYSQIGMDNTVRTDTNDRSDAKSSRRYCRTSLTRRRLFSFVILAVFVGNAAIYYFAMHPFAWVHRRCALAVFLLYRPTPTAVQCTLARTNQRATSDKTLLWNVPIAQAPPLVLEKAPAEHVHYTITTPLDVTDAKDASAAFDAPRPLPDIGLALCSMEAMTQLCAKCNCTVNVWIVDHAARSNNNTVWMDRIEHTLQSASYCMRTIDLQTSKTSFSVRGNHCPPLPSLEDARGKRRTDGQRLVDWISTPLAAQQMPAHVSDAWRLLALHELGGIYVDADVLPLKSDLLFLPATTLPMIHAVGAFRVNGAVLKLPRQSYDLHRPSTPPTLLQALIRDHISWAPRLARYRVEDQIFGFLGPCALTRIYTLRQYANPHQTVILHPDIVEGAPILPSVFCDTNNQLIPHHLAMHFTGKNKQDWLRLLRGPCLSNFVKAACLKTHQQDSSGTDGSL